MHVNTQIKAGDFAQDVQSALSNVASGAQGILSSVQTTVEPIIRDATVTVRDPKFWTWPFGSN